MPKRKRLGHGAQVTVNGSAVAMLKSFKPSEWKRDAVDVTCMDDTAMDSLDSDPPDYGEIEFTALWDAEDTDDIAIDTYFVNDDVADRSSTVVLKLRNVGTGTAPTASTWTYTTYTYTGRITSVAPAEVSSKTELARTIKMKVNAKPTKGSA